MRARRCHIRYIEAHRTDGTLFVLSWPLALAEGALAGAEETRTDSRRRARLEVTTTLEEREAARESWEAANLTLQP